MKKYISYLSDDIKRSIIPFTYKIQNKDLLNDIKNYYDTKQYLFNFYKNILFNNNHLLYYYPFYPLFYYITNDLYKFLNNGMITSYGFHKKFINIFSRFYKYKDKKKSI